jgi:hypothetical protein
MSVNLTTFERQVLDALRKQNGKYLDFHALQKMTGLERPTVQWACHQLARYGFAKYGRGLTTNDGLYAGAGYRFVSEP